MEIARVDFDSSWQHRMCTLMTFDNFKRNNNENITFFTLISLLNKFLFQFSLNFPFDTLN